MFMNIDYRVYIYLAYNFGFQGQEMKNWKDSTITDLPLYTCQGLRITITITKLTQPTRVPKMDTKMFASTVPFPHHLDCTITTLLEHIVTTNLFLF